mmetsp:Transcript_22780/g.68622  ORF Transcript_22780/g.68622 Transcript_22780/m.68622 type:complete len:238 (-) Transcript_22780:898-1611(-)
MLKPSGRCPSRSITTSSRVSCWIGLCARRLIHAAPGGDKFRSGSCATSDGNCGSESSSVRAAMADSPRVGSFTPPREVGGCKGNPVVDRCRLSPSRTDSTEQSVSNREPSVDRALPESTLIDVDRRANREVRPGEVRVICSVSCRTNRSAFSLECDCPPLPSFAGGGASSRGARVILLQKSSTTVSQSAVATVLMAAAVWPSSDGTRCPAARAATPRFSWATSAAKRLAVSLITMPR